MTRHWLPELTLHPRSMEGKLLLAGVTLTGLLVAEAAFLAAISRDLAVAAIAGVTTEIFTGREGGIPTALALGAPPALVWQLSLTQDIASFCLAFPLFLFVLHRYHDRHNRIMDFVRHMEAMAEKHQAFVHRWGPIGVAVFMLIPFLVNGPLVGGILGRLAGLHTKNLILPIVIATALAAAAWTFFFDTAFGLADAVDPRISIAITIGIVVMLAAASLFAAAREERRGRNQ